MSPASSTQALGGAGGGKGYCWNDAGAVYPPIPSGTPAGPCCREHAMTWCLAYVHPKALHCSGERGKGLGLSGGNSQGWPCPGKDSAVGVWHPKTIPGSPIQHQFKAGYLCGSCISWKDAVRGGGGAVPVPGPCRDRVRVPHPQGHNWAHAGSPGIKDTNKQYLHFFFSTTK